MVLLIASIILVISMNPRDLLHLFLADITAFTVNSLHIYKTSEQTGKLFIRPFEAASPLPLTP